MRLEHYPLQQLKKDIRRIVQAHLDLRRYHIFFFGSRVTGKGDGRSDIDVGIEGPRAVPKNILTTIREDIDALPVLYRIDVVDFMDVSSTFSRVAKQQIEKI